MNWKNRGMEKQSDAMSVQPLWHSLVDLSIIGLNVEDGDAGVTVGGGRRSEASGDGAEGTVVL